jgi:hypothetical protein
VVDRDVRREREREREKRRERRNKTLLYLPLSSSLSLNSHTEAVDARVCLASRALFRTKHVGGKERERNDKTAAEI